MLRTDTGHMKWQRLKAHVAEQFHLRIHRSHHRANRGANQTASHGCGDDVNARPPLFQQKSRYDRDRADDHRIGIHQLRPRYQREIKFLVEELCCQRRKSQRTFQRRGDEQYADAGFDSRNRRRAEIAKQHRTAQQPDHKLNQPDQEAKHKNEFDIEWAAAAGELNGSQPEHDRHRRIRAADQWRIAE